MKKNILMLTGFALVLAAAIACFTPPTKTDQTARTTRGTNPAPTASPSR